MNIAEQLKLRTYANNGQYFSEAEEKRVPFYEIVLKNGTMRVGEVEFTDDLMNELQENIGHYGSIYNVVNLFICKDDADKVIQYIEQTVGTPKKLPYWMGDMDMSPEIVDIFTSFDCYGKWDVNREDWRCAEK